ncbi:MAG: hypothetical protein O6913_10055 [Chloroflexi bacterium]|nr:hypothetical protein [Chloroflexota bacterium]
MESAAEIASIVTAIVVVSGVFVAARETLWRRWSRRRLLETYLLTERKQSDDRGQRSLLHLMRHLKLTEEQILDAAHSSRHVKLAVRTERETGFAADLLFEYCEA